MEHNITPPIITTSPTQPHVQPSTARPYKPTGFCLLLLSAACALPYSGASAALLNVAESVEGCFDDPNNIVDPDGMADTNDNFFQSTIMTSTGSFDIFVYGFKNGNREDVEISPTTQDSLGVEPANDYVNSGEWVEISFGNFVDLDPMNEITITSFVLQEFGNHKLDYAEVTFGGTTGYLPNGASGFKPPAGVDPFPGVTAVYDDSDSAAVFTTFTIDNPIISDFGTTKITISGGPGGSSANKFGLQKLRFTIVPEPSRAVLCALGLSLVCLRRRRSGF